MSVLTEQVSEFLRDHRGSLAKELVEREWEAHPELEERYGGQGQGKLLQDTPSHLLYLAQALAFDNQETFNDFVAWAKVFLVTKGLPTSDLAVHLESMADLLQEKLPGEEGSTAARFIRQAVEKLPSMPDHLAPFPEGEGPLTALAHQYLEALLRGDRRLASHLVLDTVANGTTVRDIYLQVFQPVQHRLGQLWQTNRISSAQEHYCTAATQLIMSLLYPRLFTATKKNLTLVATCVAEDLHEIGMRMVADLFELDGWTTFYLGANTPHDSVIETVIERAPEILAISATMPYHLSPVRDLIRAVRSNPACTQVKILVGGDPFNHNPDLWRQLDADGSASNAQEAVEKGNRLVKEKIAPKPLRGEASPPGDFELTPPADEEPSFYDKLFRLNNELANLQRELARKNAELEEKSSSLQNLALELASAEQRERKRLAAMLHDDIQQLLAAAGMQIARAARQIESQAAREAVSRAQQWLAEAIKGARELTLQLRPPALYEAGLTPALHWLASKMSERHDLHVRIDSKEICESLSEDLKAMLFECVRELLFNAAKYAGVDCADVIVREKPAVLEITVADRGRGFDLRKLSGPDRKKGFGLFSIRERLAALGGRITIESAPGQGTRVMLQVPIHEGAPVLPNDGERGSLFPGNALGKVDLIEVTRAPQTKVLVVDDHPIVRSGIVNILADEPQSFTTYQAADGLEAIEAIEEHHPDVVLMDLNMPRMNGIQATREIHQRWPETKIIGLSVQSNQAIIQAILDAGAVDFVTKSDAAEEIVAAILKHRGF